MNIRKNFLIVILAITGTSLLALSVMSSPMPTLAATTAIKTTTVAKTHFYYGAWLPFWTTLAGEQDIAVHLDSLNEVSPFSYELNSDGSLIDDFGFSTGTWPGYSEAIQDGGIKIIPTIADFDAAGIYSLLSNTKSRQAEETLIANTVKTQGFNGIDIDFEGMSPATRPYYSLFIEGLATRLHPKGELLTCTVVPRTPPADIYVTVPAKITYAENYSVLNQYCDEVRLMAYDQEQAILSLNATKGNGNLYGPVADPDWVKLVIQLALKSISSKKIMLGIPTYGYEYEVSWANGQTTYTRVRAFDYGQAMDRADSISQAPVRDNAGELSLTYNSSTYLTEPAIFTSVVNSPIEPAVLQTINPTATTTFFISFPDAQSEMDKVNLAKQYGLRGVMFFKADGDMDPAIWSQLTQ